MKPIHIDYDVEFYGDLSLKQIKNIRKSRLICAKNQLIRLSTEDRSYLNDDVDLEHAFKKEIRDEMEEIRCMEIIDYFDLWCIREREYEFDCGYWL